MPFTALVSKATHEYACWRGLFLTEKAGFPLFSLVGIEYLGPSVKNIA